MHSELFSWPAVLLFQSPWEPLHLILVPASVASPWLPSCVSIAVYPFDPPHPRHLITFMLVLASAVLQVAFEMFLPLPYRRLEEGKDGPTLLLIFRLSVASFPFALLFF